TRSRARRSASPASGSPARSSRQAGECAGSERLQSSGGPEVTRDDDLGAVALDGADDRLRDLLGLQNEAAAETTREEVPLWEARCLDGPGIDGVHADPARCQLPADAAGERQLRVLRGRVRG